MALGFVATEANEDLDALVAEFPWVQLHTADPGAAGATAIAGNATRKQATWASASGGSIATSADLEWSDAEVDTAETYSHFSLHTLSSAGAFGFSGTITANAISATGESFRIASGGLSISLNVAA